MKIKILKNKESKEFETWSIWSCENSEFDWTYADEEHCFIIEGAVTVTTEDNTVKIEKGDYVIFPKNLKCKWNVHSPVKKFYRFK